MLDWLAYGNNVPDTLDIRTPAGVTPQGTYTIVRAAKIAGQFAQLLYNGQPNPPYTVRSTADGRWKRDVSSIKGERKRERKRAFLVRMSCYNCGRHG